MKALRWHGTGDVSVDTVDDPEILNPTDCIVDVSLTAICGSDLHLFDGYIPTMEDGDILGHEFMGEVVEVGPEVQSLKKGDRVVVPFPIACGHCHYCNRDEYSLCDTSNPNAEMQATAYGYAAAGIFGYSHLLGGFAGGQAEYVRVPYADVGPLKVPDSLSDEQVLFLTDIYPTGYQAAVNCDIQEGDTVAVWGCGPVGLFAQISAKMLGANVIGIDRLPERLRMAEQFAGSATLNFEDDDVFERLKEVNDGRGPNACIDAVGLEAHGLGLTGAVQKAEQVTKLQTDRGTALIEAVQSCGKGGTVSVPGVYGGTVNHFNMGAAFGKGLTFKMGQTHVQKYIKDLLRHIERGELDPSYIITHKAPLAKGPELYETFRDKDDDCVKVVLDPSLPDDAAVEIRTQKVEA